MNVDLFHASSLTSRGWLPESKFTGNYSDHPRLYLCISMKIRLIQQWIIWHLIIDISYRENFLHIFQVWFWHWNIRNSLIEHTMGSCENVFFVYQRSSAKMYIAVSFSQGYLRNNSRENNNRLFFLEISNRLYVITMDW